MTEPVIQTLTDLVQKYGSLFPEVLKGVVDPVYNMELEKVFKDDDIVKLQKLGSDLPLRIIGEDGKITEWRGPLPGQQHVIAALVAAMREGTRRFILRGETGVGKTQISLMALEMAADAGFDMFPVLITEPRRVTKQWRDRVKIIVPDAVTMTITRPIDAEIFAGMSRVYRGRKKLFGFIPNSMISQGPGFRSVYRMVGYRWIKDTHGFHQSCSIFGKRDGIAVGCPVCALPFVEVKLPQTRYLVDNINSPAELEAMVRRGLRIFCPRCGSAMFEEVRPVPPGKTIADRHVRFDVGEYMIKNWKRLSRVAGGDIAKTLIVDELHKVFNMASIRGATVMNLSRKVDNMFGLGASIYSGKASSIFWIYMMFFPEAWPEWGPLDKAYDKWIDELSNEAIIEKTKIKKYGQAGNQSSKMVAVPRTTKIKKELPSAPPRLVKMLAPKTIHIKLNNLGIALPPLDLRGIKVDLDKAHLDAYQDLIKGALGLARQTHNRHVASSYLQAALTYPIAPWMETEVAEVQALQFPADYICAPERALLKFCKEEYDDDRKTVVYVTHTDTRDIVERLIHIFLDEEGLSAVRMPKNIGREDIPEWLHNEAPKSDIVILQEKSVEGVDAINFQNVIFYELDYSVWPVQQAAGRHWRLGQTRPCKTVFMEVKKTMLHRALALVMQSMCAASQIYGDEVDAQISKFNKGTLITEALRQEMEGADLPDMDDLYTRTKQVITQGVAQNDNVSDRSSNKDEDNSGSSSSGVIHLGGGSDGGSGEGGDDLQHPEKD